MKHHDRIYYKMRGSWTHIVRYNSYMTMGILMWELFKSEMPYSENMGATWIWDAILSKILKPLEYEMPYIRKYESY